MVRGIMVSYIMRCPLLQCFMYTYVKIESRNSFSSISTSLLGSVNVCEDDTKLYDVYHARPLLNG